jgi:SAM-dependent methyltransferase
MNKKYWEKFYKTFNVKKPTSFASFCLYYLKEKKAILDIGCGNGRDSYFFAKNGVYVTGVDFAVLPKNKGNAIFIKNNFKAIDFQSKPVYARFFIHAISYVEMLDLFARCHDLVMLEFRNKGDEPILYRDHERHLIDGLEVMEILKSMQFEILHFQLSRGLAVYKKEDPYICRIIAKKF